MPLSCIIIEDEPLAQERAKGYIGRLPFLHLKAGFDNAAEALVYLKTNPIDLIFLDINLGGLSGIQLLETGQVKSKVILTTAYHEFALKGYDLNVSDYLLKPYTFERFLQAVEKVQDALQKPETSSDKTFIFIKTEYRLEKILLSDILYIEGMRDYRCIYTTQKRIMTLQTFKELETEIPPSLICRVHKSFMVAIDKIESIERDRIKLNDKLIPVSDSYKKSFFERIGNL
jgi:two-component system LytT family response regulator